MSNYKCKMCGLIFKPENNKDKKIVCPKCKSPDIVKLIDGFEAFFATDSCSIKRKSA